MRDHTVLNTGHCGKGILIGSHQLMFRGYISVLLIINSGLMIGFKSTHCVIHRCKVFWMTLCLPWGRKATVNQSIITLASESWPHNSLVFLVTVSTRLLGDYLLIYWFMRPRECSSRENTVSWERLRRWVALSGMDRVVVVVVVVSGGSWRGAGELGRATLSSLMDLVLITFNTILTGPISRHRTNRARGSFLKRSAV